MDDIVEQKIDLFSADSYDQALRIADCMAGAKHTVPKHLSGNAADCLAIFLQAKRWQMDPFAVSCETFLVNGHLSYSAKLVSAVVGSSNVIEGRFKFEYGGKWESDKDASAWVRCGAKIRGDDDITWGEPVYPAKQTTKNSPLWKTNPKQQASYLAIKMWARLYTPDVILGVHTPEDIIETERAEKDITPASAMQRPEQTKPALVEIPQSITLRDKIFAAESASELKAVGVEIADTELSSEAQGALKKAYKNKLDQFKPAEDKTA